MSLLDRMMKGGGEPAPAAKPPAAMTGLLGMLGIDAAAMEKLGNDAGETVLWFKSKLETIETKLDQLLEAKANDGRNDSNSPGGS